MFTDTNSSLQLDHEDIKRVWTPDTYFPESKDGYFHELTKPNVLMHVSSNGTVLYTVRSVHFCFIYTTIYLRKV